MDRFFQTVGEKGKTGINYLFKFLPDGGHQIYLCAMLIYLSKVIPPLLSEAMTPFPLVQSHLQFQ